MNKAYSSIVIIIEIIKLTDFENFKIESESNIKCIIIIPEDIPKNIINIFSIGIENFDHRMNAQ